MLRKASRLARVPVGVPSSVKIAPAIAIPVLIVHGTNDGLIPMADVERLAHAFPQPAPIIEIAEAHHNDVAEVAGPPLFITLSQFLDPIIDNCPTPGVASISDNRQG